MPLFISFDHSLVFNGLSMHLNAGCPRLRLDRLIFPQMTHTLYFSESDDFRSQCVWKPDVDLGVSSPTLIVRSTLQHISRLPLGPLLTLLPGEDSLALSAAFPADNGYRKAKLHSVDVSIFGTVFNTEIDINEDMLYFTADAELYGNYPAKLSVTAPTNVPWNRMVITIDGQLNASTVQTIDRYVKDYILEEIINRALDREVSARQAVIRANQTLTSLAMQLRMNDMLLSKANEKFQRAFEESRVANETLRNATTRLDTSNTQIRQAQSALNQVCQEDSCMDINVHREVCQTCYQDILTEEAGMCVILQPVVPAPYVEELVGYITRRRWEYVTLCRRVCYRRFGWFSFRVSCRTRCRGVCVPIVYSVPDIRRVQRPILEEVTVPCDPPMQALEQSVPLTCCESYIERIPNVQCREMCRSAQVQATERLREVNNVAAEPFEQLNRARQVVLVANTRLARARIQRDSAQMMRDQVRKPYGNAQFATELSLINQQRLLSEIKDELKITRQYQSVGIEGIFALNSVEFKTDISTESPSILPLNFSYSSLGKEYKTSIAFDFTVARELSLRLLAEEIADKILNATSQMTKRSTPRFRRQDGLESEIVERSRNKEVFQANCVLIANIKQYIQNVLNSMQMIQDSTELAIDTLIESKDLLEMQVESDNTTTTSLVNFDALQELFNITSEDFRDNSDEEVVENYRNYFKDLANTTGEILDSVDNTSFGEWQASMEMLHNQTGSAAGYPCTGFADCLDTVTDLLKRLIADLRPGEDKHALQQQFEQSRQGYTQLATSMTLKLPDAVILITGLLETVDDEILSTYWCSSSPNITEQPPMQVNVSSGSDFTLDCPYESSLPVSAHWRKDGVPIPGSNSSTLVVPKANIMDSGNYTCHIANAVGMESSLNVSVLVYELPEFFQVLRPVTTYAGNESGAWFSCNASAWPYPGWGWYYRAHESDPWIQFEGEDTNELTILSPQKEDEGWYTCEAYNNHGYLRAPPVYLTVLPVSVAQLGLKIEFIATSRENIQRYTSGFAPVEEVIVNFIREEIKDKSVTIHDLNIDVTVDLNSLTTFKIAIIIISNNVTTEDTKTMILRDIENNALPSRGDVILAKQTIQKIITDGTMSIVDEYEHVDLYLQDYTFNFHTPEYFCPPGQELHTNFLLCGELNVINNTVLSRKYAPLFCKPA